MAESQDMDQRVIDTTTGGGSNRGTLSAREAADELTKLRREVLELLRRMDALKIRLTSQD